MLAQTARTEQVLEHYYDQFVEWAVLLARGDKNQAQDLVHDFCLHLAITQPDLSAIANLDGYLYKSLRHIYLSRLARSSREALQFLTVGDFDSIQLAFAPHRSIDPLQLQNDLRRICCYSVWRKDQTKSASYFILRFFHGYHTQEIANLACSPIGVLYTKLREFRIEVRTYLEEPNRIRFIGQSLPPRPVPVKDLISSLELFTELRQTILATRTGACLPEEELIAAYQVPHSKPISCSLLSHLVSCERCLTVMDRYFNRPTLDQRGLLDESDDLIHDTGGHNGKPASTSRSRLLASVRRFRNEMLEHRPQTLSIAINGKIIASHSVRSQRNVLSARIEHPENVRFVEAFSEQDVRLAQLSIDELPPHGPHEQTQHIDLSDGRWLELHLLFDGLGLSSELVYFDPTLEQQGEEIEADEFVRVSPRTESWVPNGFERLPERLVTNSLNAIRRLLQAATPSPVAAWFLVIASIFCTTGYLVFRKGKTLPALNAREVLERSIQVEAAGLNGQTEHQVLRFEEASMDGDVLRRGTVDVWKDGNGKRYLRRLYDGQHHLLAAEWVQSNGKRGEYIKAHNSQMLTADHGLLDDGLWKQDVSPSAFTLLNGENAQIRPTDVGYELTITTPQEMHPEIVSATLILDHSFHAIREIVRVRSGNDIHEARLIQADYERRPTTSVPDATFDPTDRELLSKVNPRMETLREGNHDVQLTELYIAVLYELNGLNADANEPIEIERTGNGRIRITGTLANGQRKQEILSHLNLLEGHRFLDLHLVSPEDARKHAIAHSRTVTRTINIYNVDKTKAPADAALRRFFQSQGMSGAELDTAVLEYSRGVLKHAQSALQRASALDRLGSAFKGSELGSASIASQRQWTDMVKNHATALDAELCALHEQLSQLSPSHNQPTVVMPSGIMVENPAQFRQEANQLLVKIQNLNRAIGNIFASSLSSQVEPADINSQIAKINLIIPLQEAADMTGFAVKLNASGETASSNRQHRSSPAQSY